MTRNERAAAMRQMWLGDAAGEAVAWDELKQCVRDRWLAALDAAQPESRPVKVRWDVTASEVEAAFADGNEEDSWQSVMDYLAAHAVIDVPAGVPSVEELIEIGRQANTSIWRMSLDEMEKNHKQGWIDAAAAIRDAVLAGVQAGATVTMIGKTLTPDTFGPEDGTPAPLSDEMIERMAEAAQKTMWRCGATWPDAIRAALAAGGLEPCPVPEYDPADVAISTPIIADLHKQLEAARREVDEVRRHISVTMSREHQARKEAQEAKRESHDLRTQLTRESEWVRLYKQDRDAALAELADLRDEVDDDNTNAAAVNDLLIRVQNLAAERDALRERASVPVPAGVPELSALVKLYESVRDSKEKRTGLPLEHAVAVIRDPVGWEPITLEEYTDMRNRFTRGYDWEQQLSKEYDWIRSRIRPTFECKECAGIRAERDEINKNYMGLVDLFLPYLRAAQAEAAARAALEGE